jgi:TetR/AcrR family transcriptional repressor of nem operon
MRYDAEHKQKTRERVLTEAAKAIRLKGPDGVSVAGVMGRAGLTHGAFYAHFRSKDALIAAGIERMFEDGRGRLAKETAERGSPRAGLAGYIDFYLSPEHRDARSWGCPLPYLSAEARRLSEASREGFARGVARLTGSLADALVAMGEADADAKAASTLAEMVGALSLARAEPDTARSDAILAASRASIKRRFDLGDAA